MDSPTGLQMDSTSMLQLLISSVLLSIYNYSTFSTQRKRRVNVPLKASRTAYVSGNSFLVI